MGIILDEGDFGTYLVVDANTDKSILIQTDWDHPGVANTFGWVPKRGRKGCRHDGTDGTVDCDICGRTASEFIAEATQYLDDNIGAEAEDPGYFD